MVNVFKQIVEYVIRHLRLNSVCVKLVDKLLKDRVQGSYYGAKELLRGVYEPADFSCEKQRREVERKYNLQIIIPMYNVRHYIGRCLESVLCQETKYSYIVYVVDDGSTDGSEEQVRSMCSDDRVILITKSNGGTAAARNLGMEKIVADYVMFIDADDMLKQGAVESLLDTAYREDADVVEGGYEVFRKKVIKKVTHEDEIVKAPCGKLWGFSWGKVFRGELFTDFWFPENYWYEDTFISYLFYTKCKRTVTISDIVYLYRHNMRGMSHIRKNEKKLLDAFWIINLVIEEMYRQGVPFSGNIYEQLLVSISTSSKRILFLDRDLRTCVLSAYAEILHTHFEEYRTETENMKVFEKVLRNNDFRKYCYIVICMESL